MSLFHATPVEITGCPRCHVPVLGAWADGHPVLAELTPVVRSGEIAAIREGLATFLLRAGRLEHRTDEQIAGERDSAPILAEHKCARPIPYAHIDARSISLVTTPITEGVPF